MDISLFRAVAHDYQGLRRVNSVPMMTMISHLIEEQIVAQQLPVELYVGFQRFSNLRPQQRRYQQLGAICRRVVVFGLPDREVPPIPGVEFVALPQEAALTREWFLVVNAPEFWTALLTREAEQPTPGRERNYEGLWSYDAPVVERASLLLSQALGTHYQPVYQRDHERQSTHVAAISGRLVARLERAQLSGERRWIHLCALQKLAEALARNRRTAALASEVAAILRQVFGADDATLALRLADQRFLVASAHTDTPQERTLALDHGASGEAFRNRRTMSVADTRRSRALDPLMPGARSLIAAPIAGRRRTYGVLAVGGEQAAQWTDEDAQTVTAMAHLLAGVLDQRADALDDAALRLERTQALEQTLASLRQAADQIARLTRELELLAASGLTPTQRMAVTHAAELAAELARTIAAGAGAEGSTSPANERLLDR
jgi:DICT domain-containing protein